MYRFTDLPHWITRIFSLFCLFQVKTWFDEIIDAFRAAANSFTIRGERFLVLPNRSFIIDESLGFYGNYSSFRDNLN